MFTRYAQYVESIWKLAEDWPMTDRPLAGTMQDARLIEAEVLVPKPKRFVRGATDPGTSPVSGQTPGPGHSLISEVSQ
jgi:hypothetical protein